MGRAKINGRPLWVRNHCKQHSTIRLDCFYMDRQIISAREPEVFDAKKPDLRFSIRFLDGLEIHVPIEIKWSHHDEVWTALENQLVYKYMQDPTVRYGLYLVGWTGNFQEITSGPPGQKPVPPEQFESDLREIAPEIMDRRGKNVAIYVLDCTV